MRLASTFVVLPNLMIGCTTDCRGSEYGCKVNIRGCLPQEEYPSAPWSLTFSYGRALQSATLKVRPLPHGTHRSVFEMVTSTVLHPARCTKRFCSTLACALPVLQCFAKHSPAVARVWAFMVLSAVPTANSTWSMCSRYCNALAVLQITLHMPQLRNLQKLEAGATTSCVSQHLGCFHIFHVEAYANKKCNTSKFHSALAESSAVAATRQALFRGRWLQ